MEAQSCHDLSFKELPTREQKLRRIRDRRDSPTLPPLRLRHKNGTSPLHEMDMEKSHSSDRSVSSSPDGVSLHLSPNSAFNSYRYAPRADPAAVASVVVTEASSSFAEASDHSSKNKPCESATDIEQPLDMSTKRSQDVATKAQSVDVQQQQRPSVITCASALLRTQCSLADVTHHICNVAVADPSTGDESQSSGSSDSSDSESNSNSSDSSKHESVRPGHRREIVSGSCDPVIDEHFRRSLGKDYQQVFSKSAANSVSITVDDHFAKALGDTWHQLQQSSTPAVDSPQQTASSQNLHSKQFLQQSPEIVST